MICLSDLAREFINRFQGGFPLSERPFLRVAVELGISETSLLALVRDLLKAGYLSRFGPIYDASRLGGGQTLAALSVPEAEFSVVAQIVNALPEVAHNYRREHTLNMWFVVAATSPDRVALALRVIADRTGLKVYEFPKLHEFYLGLWLELQESGAVDTIAIPATVKDAAGPLDELDRRIIEATQGGLPLVAEPVEAIARRVEASSDAVGQRLQRMLASGAIRRIGAVPNHYRLGLRANGMTVWDVPDDMALELGKRIGALNCVSHSYLRPRHAGVWWYNLFAMVHGRDRAQVVAKSEMIAQLLGPDCRARDTLYSTGVLKKTGLRLAA
jgi:DNA-binding Lrp family transcriptional regulator